MTYTDETNNNYISKQIITTYCLKIIKGRRVKTISTVFLTLYQCVVLALSLPKMPGEQSQRFLEQAWEFQIRWRCVGNRMSFEELKPQKQEARANGKISHTSKSFFLREFAKQINNIIVEMLALFRRKVFSNHFHLQAMICSF